MYSVSEVADKLGVTNMHVYRLIQSGKLKAENVGVGERRPTYRVRESAINEYLTMTT